MSQASWETSFHVHPHTGWINDPNGLCYFRGRYHAFYQYAPDWPASQLKYWGHATSTNLLSWTHEEVALSPDIAHDKDGVFSGSAYISPAAAHDGGERMLVYYTGNVICPAPSHNVRDKHYVFDGREGNTLLVTTDDGLHFSKKQLVLGPQDYPSDVSCHVRDPKLWEQDESLHMMLGARSLDDAGCVLIYDSQDGVSWTYRQTIQSTYPFGYMWECPGLVQLKGHEFLMMSPQGLPRLSTKWRNLWQSGYLPLDKRVLDCTEVDETNFVEWDCGHDFYAPQCFVDAQGRTILIGWMGGFDKRQNSHPEGLVWNHCLTLPRELSLNEAGRICQLPVEELTHMRGAKQLLLPGKTVEIDGFAADISCQMIGGSGTLCINGELELRLKTPEHAAASCELVYLDSKVSQGRENRLVTLDESACVFGQGTGYGLENLRVIVDGSTIEVYLNDGAQVISSRWFSRSDTGLRLQMDIPCEQAFVWKLDHAHEAQAAPAAAQTQPAAPQAAQATPRASARAS